MRFSAGTAHSSSTISPVGDPRTPILCSSFDDREPGEVLLDDEAADAPVARVGIGLGEHRVEVADARVGDPELAARQHVVVAVAYRLRCACRPRRCPRRPRRGSTTPGTRRSRRASTYFAPERVAAVVEHRRHRELGDEREQRRRRADARHLLDADRVREEAAALAAELLREREARRSPRRATRATNPRGTASSSSARAAFGAILSSARRRTEARSSSRSSERVKLVNRGPFAATSAVLAGSRERGHRRAPRLDLGRSLRRTHPQQRVGHRVDERAPAPVVVARPRARARSGPSRTPRSRCRRSRAARSARSMSPMTGARPNCAARLPATSAMTAIASSACSYGPSRKRSLARCASV